MPLSGFLVSKLLNLPSYYAAGLILVGCCPGGTASNIVTYIARGNVALSVLMTAASTLSAVIMTPFLTAKLAGQYVAVDAAGLLVSTLQVVLLPVLAGAFLNQYFQGLVKFVSPLMPPIAVTTVAVLCGNAIAQSASAILMSGQQVVLAAFLLHASGFFFGYMLSRMLGIDVSSSRTISIEVGMQSLARELVILFAGIHHGRGFLRSVADLLTCWKGSLGNSEAGKVWKMIPHCIMWCLWRERNDRTFNGVEKSIPALKFYFLHTLLDWSKASHLDLSSSLSNLVDLCSASL
uniref:Uncharacterized protein n=1 Tax=Fagus sylvatica TaxID=28930 RepID=A0A2N9FAH5_FAGSY